ncbi:MAG: heme exporter protein CcmB [Candidatus Hydrothermarchaeota archaeon]|nr:heme exporter protein CcmB [Candidatus Hydrothermarchaeota archaeon]
MNFKRAFILAGKDLRIEFRSRQTLNFMFLFSFVTLLMFNFAVVPYSQTAREVAPGFLWFVLIFAGLLGLSRAFVKEKESGTLEGLKLSPMGYNEILLGKIVYNLVLVLAIELIAFPLFIVLFSYSIEGSALDALLILTLGSVGLVVVGSFLSAAVLSARSRELVLQIVVLPLLLPVIIPTIMALREVMLYGTPLPGIKEIKLILFYIIVVTTLSSLLFSYVMEE